MGGLLSPIIHSNRVGRVEKHARPDRRVDTRGGGRLGEARRFFA